MKQLQKQSSFLFFFVHAPEDGICPGMPLCIQASML